MTTTGTTQTTYVIQHKPGTASSTVRVYLNGKYEDGATAEGGTSADRFNALHEWVAERYPLAEPRSDAEMEARTVECARAEAEDAMNWI